MNKKNYTFLMILGVISMLLSCGTPTETIATLSTVDSDLKGKHYWYLGFAEEKVPVMLVATDCDTLFKLAIPVALKLNEKISLPGNVTAEYKEISLGVYNTDRALRDMKPDSDGYQAIAKLLSGSVGSKQTITFFSETALSRSEINEYLEYKDSFYISDLDFTVNGKIHKKELYNCLFNGESLDTVIDNFATLVNELCDAYELYEENGTSKEYEVLETLYKKAYVMSDKMEASIDDDDISNGQYNRLSRAYESFYEIFQEM